MDDAQVTVRRFSWPDLCPALLIFRALPTALSMTVLGLALAGAILTPIGWIMMDAIFVSDEMVANDPGLALATEVNGSSYKWAYPEWRVDRPIVIVLGNQLRGVELVFRSVVNSAGGMFSLESGLLRFLYYLGGCLWSILVWSFLGCAICRAALMRYTRDDPIGIRDSIEFAADKFLSCFAGVGIPLLAVLGLSALLFIPGLLMATDVGAVITGFFWLPVLALSLMIAIILLGLTFAWPLIISAISCEGQDSFDGMSRAFAYVFQRPLHYFAYALLAIVFSGICWMVMSFLLEGTIHTAWWATSWGSNISTNRTAELGNPVSRPAAAAAGESTNGSLTLARNLIQFWIAAARTIGAAFLTGLFWCVVSAMYLLLRKDLDNTEMDEIWLVDQRRTYELPPLSETDSGVPAVETQPPEVPNDQGSENSESGPADD